MLMLWVPVPHDRNDEQFHTVIDLVSRPSRLVTIATLGDQLTTSDALLRSWFVTRYSPRVVD